jgi:hypothetical protein
LPVVHATFFLTYNKECKDKRYYMKDPQKKNEKIKERSAKTTRISTKTIGNKNSHSRYSLPSFPCSQEPISGPYPKPDESNP